MSASVCTHAYNYTGLLSSYLPTNATQAARSAWGGLGARPSCKTDRRSGEFIYATALRNRTSKSSTNRRLAATQPAERAAQWASPPPITVPESPKQRSSSSEPSPASTDPCAETWSRRASAARAAPLRAPRCRWVRSQTRAHDSLPWRRLVSSASRVPPATDAEHPSPSCSHRGADRAALRAPQIAASVGVALGDELIERRPRSGSVRRAELVVFAVSRTKFRAALLGCGELSGGRGVRLGVAAVAGSRRGLASGAATPAAGAASSAGRAES